VCDASYLAAHRLLKASTHIATETAALARWMAMKPHTMPPVAIAAVALSLGMTCGEGGILGIPPQATQLAEQDVHTLVVAPSSGVEERQRAVLTSPQEWTALWDRAYANHMPRPPVPTVDFAERIVVVAAMGPRSSGGYAIRVDAVHRDGDDLYVRVHEISPGARCLVSAVLTAPVTAVALPRLGGQVVFVESAETRDC
jgi:hypothetical protein